MPDIGEPAGSGFVSPADRLAMSERREADNPKEQEEVLEKKGHVTETPERGLQQWGDEGPDVHDEGIHGGAAGGYGDASMGTAERAASIGGLAPGYKPGQGAHGQMPAEAEDEQEEPDETE